MVFIVYAFNQGGKGLFHISEPNKAFQRTLEDSRR
jgi:hypothetical protein